MSPHKEGIPLSSVVFLFFCSRDRPSTNGNPLGVWQDSGCKKRESLRELVWNRPCFGGITAVLERIPGSFLAQSPTGIMYYFAFGGILRSKPGQNGQIPRRNPSGFVAPKLGTSPQNRQKRSFLANMPQNPSVIPKLVENRYIAVIRPRSDYKCPNKQHRTYMELAIGTSRDSAWKCVGSCLCANPSILTHFIPIEGFGIGDLGIAMRSMRSYEMSEK